MDYKKAYEEALERANGIYNENPSSSTAKFVCGQIFPELKESEDERIRKEIINYLLNEQHNVKQLTPRTNEFEAWIAYLEKQKEKQPAEWSAEDEEILDAMIDMVSNSLYEPLCPREGMLAWLKAIHPHPAKSPLAEGVYYIKNGKPVAEYEDGVETDRLLIIGKYCRFYLSMADLGKANYEDAQNKAASLGEGWRCPDSFEGRTIGKMSDEIREKSTKIGAEHFKDKVFFWTNEVFDRWGACSVDFFDGDVGYDDMDSTGSVLALSAFQD